MQSMDDDEIFPEQQKEEPIIEKMKTKVKYHVMMFYIIQNMK